MGHGSSTRRYTPEFKRDAVALVHSSGRPIRVVAKELGVADSSLGTWVRNAAGPAPHHLRAQAKAEKDEEARLRKRIRELETEIDILKRFTAYWVRTSD